MLEDNGEAVACKVTFSEGFQPASHAHQAAQTLIRLMDEQCNKLGPIPEPSLIVVDGA